MGKVVDFSWDTTTPSCVGNTQRSSRAQWNNKLHPRVCGEYQSPVTSYQSPGSCRFTPACAGNTVQGYGGENCTPVHPRVCGKYYQGTMSGVEVFGSPPGVREYLERSIPGNAGDASFDR